MVSQSTIQRQPFIVFVTVGSTQTPFKRLYDAIGACNNITFEIAQQSFQNGLSEFELIASISHADKVIIHSSPSSLYLVAKYAKNMPLIIPRRMSFKEAVGDHQLHYARFIKHSLPQKYKKYIVTPLDISRFVSDYLSQKSEKNVLKDNLFPTSSQELLKRSFNDLLQQKGILE